MAEYKGMSYLKNKLTAKQVRVQLRYSYYEMKNVVKDFGISTPPDLKYWMGCLGWCGNAVDSLADRISFREFSNDHMDLNSIYNLNNKDVMVDSLVLGALISSCDFIYITADEYGDPTMRAIDGAHATGIIDPITNMLREGYAVLEFDEYDNPIIEAYFTKESTAVYMNGRRAGEMPNPADYPLLVPVINRPDAKRPFGHSRISRACMSIVASAVRTAKRSEIAAEFYSYPQKYVLGMDPSAEAMDKWRATMSSMFRVDKDQDGDHPVVGQFQQQSMAPHTEQMRMFAGMFAGETGLTLDDLGFPTDNPSSSEAIKASHEALRLKAKKAQKNFGTGLLNAGFLAACVRDKRAYKRSVLYDIQPKWEPIFDTSMTALSGIGDAALKLQSAFPDYFTDEKLRDLMGV